MAKNKIERIDQEIAKTREKIAEQQEKLKDLEAQKTEAENLEIVQMVRALRMTCLMLMGGFSVTAFAQGTDPAPTATPAADATNDSNVVVEETEDSPALTP